MGGVSLAAVNTASRIARCKSVADHDLPRTMKLTILWRTQSSGSFTRFTKQPSPSLNPASPAKAGAHGGNGSRRLPGKREEASAESSEWF
jgi:hypothetical protein